MNEHEAVRCFVLNFIDILFQVFDASDYFSFAYNDEQTLYPVVSCEEGLKKDDPSRYSTVCNF